MFSKALLLVLGCISLFSAQAQNDDIIIPEHPATPQPAITIPSRPTMELGITGGGGLSILYNQQPLQNPRTPDKAPYASTAFGVSYQYNFPKIVSIRAELNMERKGDEMYLTNTVVTNAEGQPMQVTNYGYDRFNYLTLPVMARLGFGKRVQFFTDLGIYAGVLFNAERVTSTSYILPQGNNVAETSNSEYISQGLRQLDGGVVTGIGLSVPIWKGVGFSLEARNNLGLANINANNLYYGNKLYNDNFNVLAGLNFFLSNNKNKRSSDKLPDLR